MGSPEREDEYRRLTEALYKRYLSAPPEQEIIVVTAEPDDICRICAVGEHCVTRIRRPLDKDTLKKEPYKSLIKERGYEDTFLKDEDCTFNCFRDAYNHLYKWEHIKRPPRIEEVTLRFIDCYYPVKARRFVTDKESFIWAAGLMDAYYNKYFDHRKTYQT